MNTMNFYAPIQMPAGHWIYGAAAANHRAKLAGGWNLVVATMYKAGLEYGMQAAYQDMMRNAQRGR